MTDGSGGTADGTATLTLFAWLSPNFPIGSFAFSHGLEWAVEAGDIGDAATLRAWLDDLLRHGASRADAALLAAVWRDPARAVALNDLALALAPSAERRLETAAQGTAFASAVAAAWPSPVLERLALPLAGREIAYPVAFGLAASAHALPLRATLETFTLAGVANLVSAAIRLGVIGQSDAQRIVAGFLPVAGAIAASAEAAPLDEALGTCAWRSDLAAMHHETQYSRLFRS